MPSDLGGTFSTYHGFESGRATHVELDATTTITSILNQSVHLTNDRIEWATVNPGRDPTTTVAVIESGYSRGVSYAPYAGPSMSLTRMPTDLFVTGETPRVVRVKTYAVDGLDYRGTAAFEEQVGIGRWARSCRSS
jgi:hypothetical protein